MNETYIDVKPADVRVGDEVKVDGIGIFTNQSGQMTPVELAGRCYETVSDVGLVYVSIKDGSGATRFRRSSIVAARRRIEAPKPEPMRCGNLPGDWTAWMEFGSAWVYHGQKKPAGRELRVYRSTGWSKDERTRERRGSK